jgi:hypothetical protein
MGDRVINLPPALDTPEFHAAWTAWEAHRREIRKKLTPTSQSRQLASLAAVGVANAIRTIEVSIEKGWTGLFPEQIRGNGKPALYQGLKDFVGDEQ